MKFNSLDFEFWIIFALIISAVIFGIATGKITGWGD